MAAAAAIRPEDDFSYRKQRSLWEGSATEEKGQPIINPQNKATESTGLSLAMGLGYYPWEAGDTMAVVFHFETLP